MQTTANPPAPDMLRVRQVADAIGCSVATVRRRIADGSLYSVKLGGLVLIPRASLVALTRPL